MRARRVVSILAVLAFAAPLASAWVPPHAATGWGSFDGRGVSCTKMPVQILIREDPHRDIVTFVYGPSPFDLECAGVTSYRADGDALTGWTIQEGCQEGFVGPAGADVPFWTENVCLGGLLKGKATFA